MGLFSVASVAFNILHAIDQQLVAAGWVAALAFAMPPVALLLATHLLLQQGVWRRQHSPTGATARESLVAGAPQRPVDSPAPSSDRPAMRSASSPTIRSGTGGPPAHPIPQPAAADGATKDRARQLYVEA